jgi:hypothetical protein
MPPAPSHPETGASAIRGICGLIGECFRGWDVENPLRIRGDLRMSCGATGASIRSCRSRSRELTVTRETRPDGDRDQLLDRLKSLRTIVPVFAQELASTRRQTAQLRLENGRLLEQVRQLQRQHIAQGHQRRLAPRAKARTPGKASKG